MSKKATANETLDTITAHVVSRLADERGENWNEVVQLGVSHQVRKALAPVLEKIRAGNNKALHDAYGI